MQEVEQSLNEPAAERLFSAMDTSAARHPDF
jgi:hypothetical protein